MNYIEEKNINIGDQFIFIDSEYGDKIYKLILLESELYFYVERSDWVPWNQIPRPFPNPVKAFNMNSLYAQSCVKFDREDEINKLLNG